MKRVISILISITLIFALSWLVWVQLTNLAKNVSNTQSVISQTRQIFPSFVDRQLAKMTLKQKVSSLLILHTPGTDVTTLSNFLKIYQPGGLIFMGDNIPETLEQTISLTGELQTSKFLPYLFAIDEEGGVVKRLGDDTFPAAIDLKDEPINATQEAFRNRSILLHQTGFNLNFGIVADITYDTNSFIYSRVFGGDPVVAGDRVAAAVTASKGLTLSTLKHFPGHGETEADSHVSIPTTDVTFEDWQLRDKPSFQQGVNAGADVVMFGHLCYDSVDPAPATLSVKWHDILKNQLHFAGLTITDDMMMLQDSGEVRYSDPITNAVDAIRAGNTMLLYVLGSDNAVSGVNIDVLINGIVASVNEGKISQELINKNVRQVLTVRHSLAK